MNTLSNDQCYVCGSNQLVTIPDSGEIVCQRCGAVISDRTVEKGSEWRTFVTSTAGREGDDENRTGMPFSLARSDMGLSTVIGRTNKDARGSEINSSMLSRLRKRDSRTQVYTSTDKNLTQAFTQLDTLKDKLGLSDVIVEKTAYIFRKAEERALLRGRAISSILAAAIYIACREMGMPRTLNEIASSSIIRLRTLAMDYRLLVILKDNSKNLNQSSLRQICDRKIRQKHCDYFRSRSCCRGSSYCNISAFTIICWRAFHPRTCITDSILAYTRTI